MRDLLIRQLFLISAFILTIKIGEAQEYQPYHIDTYGYSVKYEGNNYKIDTLQLHYEEFFNADGSKRTMEEFGVKDFDEQIKYDSSGNVLEKKVMGPDGTFFYGNRFKYDSLNRIREWNEIDENGAQITRVEIEYDTQGNKIRTERFEDDTISFFKSIYQYDTATHQKRQIEYKKGIFDVQYIYKYDDNENIIEAKILDSHEQCFSRTIYKYNNNNDLILECTFDNDNNILYTKSIEYAFDEYGFWTERKEFENDSLIQIIDRKIKYFHELPDH